MKKFKGSYTIAFTPFYEDGSVDYDQFEKEVEYLSKTGAQGVVYYGMTSEYHKLTDAEKRSEERRGGQECRCAWWAYH